MSASVNKVIIVGNLGADPELRFTKSDTPVCELRIATNEGYKDKDGEWQERTEWHRITVWGKTGENCDKYLSKGRQVYVEGRLQTRKWEDSEGNDRYTTEIIANDVQFLSGGGGGSDSSDDEEPRRKKRRPKGRGRGRQDRARKPKGRTKARHVEDVDDYTSEPGEGWD